MLELMSKEVGKIKGDIKVSNLHLITTTPDKNQIPTMLTIKELAECTKLSYSYIRKLCIENKIVYIKSGTKYLVNYNRFIEFLNTGTI